jgi:hypothetical protein
MRMDPTQGMSARQWLVQASERDIAEVLRDYGEERFAVPVAKAIAARCRDAGDTAFRTTGELAALVAGVVRGRQKRPEVGKDPATRTFQALRILVNQELEELALVLDRIVGRLNVGGRMVVLSFHSLEDRMVKQFIAREAGRTARRDPVTGVPVHDTPPRLERIGRRLPDEADSVEWEGWRFEVVDLDGKRVIVVEDTSTTGGSPLAAAAALEKVGAVVVAIAVVVDRNTGAREVIEKAGYEYRAAISLSDLGLDA